MLARAVGALTTLTGDSASSRAGIEDLADAGLASPSSSLSKLLAEHEHHSMSTPQLIGIVIGGLFAFFAVAIIDMTIMWICWRCCCEGDMRSYFGYAKQSKNSEPEDPFTGDLRPTTLFGCFKMEFKNICEGLLCPFFVFVENLDRAKPVKAREDVTCKMWLPLAVKSLCTCGIYYLYVRTTYRLKLARLPPGATSETSGLSACCVVFWCCNCSVMQEAQFLEQYDVYSNGKGIEEGAPKQQGMAGPDP